MPLIYIPIEFEYEGILFSGTFSTTKGNEDVWQLSLAGYRYGQLVHYYDGWKWCPGLSNDFTEPYMEEFFIKTVEDYLNRVE